MAFVSLLVSHFSLSSHFYMTKVIPFSECICLVHTCECLARLAIPNKIPKCLLTRFSNSFLDYLPNEDQVVEFVKRQRYVVEVGV